MRTIKVDKQMTGSQMAKEMRRERMQNLRMLTAIVLIILSAIIFIPFVIRHENKQVEEIPQYDAVWRGTVTDTTTVESWRSMVYVPSHNAWYRPCIEMLWIKNGDTIVDDRTNQDSYPK